MLASNVLGSIPSPIKKKKNSWTITASTQCYMVVGLCIYALPVVTVIKPKKVKVFLSETVCFCMLDPVFIVLEIVISDIFSGLPSS